MQPTYKPIFRLCLCWHDPGRFMDSTLTGPITSLWSSPQSAPASLWSSPLSAPALPRGRRTSRRSDVSMEIVRLTNYRYQQISESDKPTSRGCDWTNWTTPIQLSVSPREGETNSLVIPRSSDSTPPVPTRARERRRPTKKTTFTISSVHTVTLIS